MKQKNGRINVIALIIGVVLLFVFNFLGEIFQFWMIGFLPSQSISTIDEANTIIKDHLFFFVFITICTSFVKFIIPGFTVALIASGRRILHGILLGVFASLYLILTNLPNITSIGFDLNGIFIVFNAFLSFVFCLGGALIYKKWKERGQ